jgi:anaerobic magnesium-protoporphyrin IX monomethyl ester cyclase
VRFALVNPNWSFGGSIYFGCREPHLPLEYGYGKALLERAGHEAGIIDGHLLGLSMEEIRRKVEAFRPDFTVVTTAPSYLFWRCAPPELRVPQELTAELAPVGGTLVAVGPHGSSTPRAAFRKLGVDILVMGECEEILPRLAAEDWSRIPSIALGRRHAPFDEVEVHGGPWAGNFTDLPALSWPADWLKRHRHHHHRFDRGPAAPGAEVEASRGCPYKCSFCAKENFRDRYRRRPAPVVLEEIDGLLAQGVEYVYFIDEIFLPDAKLLEGLAGRKVEFGMQTRIDLWKPAMLELLGRAGCVSIEAGVESLTPEGRQALDKNCRMSTDELTERLIVAKRHVPFVQANLIKAGTDDPAEVAAWREHLMSHGVWANEPVPLFPYPGSPDYRKLWGMPDDHAWERALDHYLKHHVSFSDIQDDRPLPLRELERPLSSADA